MVIMHKIKQQNNRDGNSAQALVELALLLPLIVLLVLGAMDFGRLFTTKIVLNNAAREGSYYITTYPCDALDSFSGTRNAALAEAIGLGVELASENIQVNYSTLDNGCCTRGEKIDVQVSQTVDLIFDGPLQALGLIGGPIELTSVVSMVVQ